MLKNIEKYDSLKVITMLSIIMSAIIIIGMFVTDYLDVLKSEHPLDYIITIGMFVIFCCLSLILFLISIYISIYVKNQDKKYNENKENIFKLYKEKFGYDKKYFLDLSEEAKLNIHKYFFFNEMKLILASMLSLLLTSYIFDILRILKINIYTTHLIIPIGLYLIILYYCKNKQYKIMKQ